MGAKAYHIIEKYKSNLEGCVVEIGSGLEEGSTEYLSEFCSKNDMYFYTVTIDGDIYETLRKKFPTNMIPRTRVFHMSGETFFANQCQFKVPIKDKICFAYLDNFDFMFPTEPEDYSKYVRLYAKKYNLELSNTNSKLVHLTQTCLMLPLLAKTSFVLFDDTWCHDRNTYDGKGGFAVPFLRGSGFKVIETSHPDTIEDSYILMGRFSLH